MATQLFITKTAKKARTARIRKEVCENAQHQLGIEREKLARNPNYQIMSWSEIMKAAWKTIKRWEKGGYFDKPEPKPVKLKAADHWDAKATTNNQSSYWA